MIWITRFFLDWAIIVLCFFLAASLGWVSWWPIALIIGSRIHALFEIGHNAAHRSVFRNKLDNVYAILVLTPLGISLKKYRKFHLAHHRHVGNDKLDPEVKLQKKFRNKWINPSWTESLKDSLGLNTYETLLTLKELSSFKSFLSMMAIICVLYLVIGPIAFLWILSMLTGLPVAHRLRAQTEHQHLIYPGKTIYKTKPQLWKRLWYLPHDVWMHHEHHSNLK